jgi:hypothetical protein
MTTSQRPDEFNEQDMRIADNARLRFAPPYIELASVPQGFNFHWSKLQLAFALPNPHEFPPLAEALSKRDVEAVNRYVATCRELATYSLLNHGGGVSISWSAAEGETVIETDQPTKEALRGFAVLFRQIHSDADEPGSFKVVRSILSSTSAKATDDLQEVRMDIIKQWSRARARLLQRSLSDICQSQIRKAQGAPEEGIPIFREHTPVQLMALFNYGEYIHWGDKRGDHAALFQDEISGSLSEFEFHDILISFAHFYLGYSKLLETAFQTQR